MMDTVDSFSIFQQFVKASKLWIGKQKVKPDDPSPSKNAEQILCYSIHGMLLTLHSKQECKMYTITE